MVEKGVEAFVVVKHKEQLAQRPVSVGRRNPVKISCSW